MTGKLAGKIAVVTGGSAGIGLGIAKRFAQEGGRVFIIGRRQAQLDQAVADIGGDAAAIQGDISNLADLDRIYATAEAQAGPGVRYHRGLLILRTRQSYDFYRRWPSATQIPHRCAR